jgi:hypothetical protein
MENYQKADGSIEVPEILQSYVGTKVIMPKGSKQKSVDEESELVVKSEKPVTETPKEETKAETPAPEAKI